MPDAAPHETAQRILAAALPLFAAHGHAGTSVRRIARAADVNVATLAYHFGGKDGLYAACVDAMYSELAALDTPDLSKGDPFHVLAATTWHFARDHRDHARLLHRHLLDEGRHTTQLMDGWHERLMGRVEPVLRALRPDGTATEARLMVLTVVHLSVRFVLDDPADLRAMLALPDDADLDAVMADWLATVLRRLVTAPASEA